MFEVNMDEYLDEEVEYLKQICDTICKDWDRQVKRFCFLYATLTLFFFFRAGGNKNYIVEFENAVFVFA
jgi:hypothetical protein